MNDTPHATEPWRSRRVVSSLLLDPRVGDYFVPVVEPLPGWALYSSGVQVDRIVINTQAEGPWPR